MSAYYNEIDPKAAAWLRELISAGLIAKGDVDDRSIADVRGSELASYTQCHFFAGIGGWSYALRLAGIRDDEPWWTGSCPCQPFSQAGQGKGEQDERHLWPHLCRLIEECRPARVSGEQVASKAGRRWLDGVRTDLEAMDYEVGAADLCSPGVGAPHIRQRLYWMAQPEHAIGRPEHKEHSEAYRWNGSGGCSESFRVGHANDPRSQGRRIDTGEYASECAVGPASSVGGVDDTAESRRTGHGISGTDSAPRDETRLRESSGSGSLSPFWNLFDIVHCTDEKARRIEPCTFPLAHGIPARMGRLRGYGNAIVPQVAAEVIRAFIEAIA